MPDSSRWIRLLSQINRSPRRPPMSSRRAHVCVFDWDHSTVADNTDTFIPNLLAPGLLDSVRRAHPGAPWTSLMHEVARELHARGHTRADMERALRALPFFEEVPRACSALSAAGVRSFVLSDANSFYISTGASAMGIAHHLVEVVTNGAHFDAEGRLHITPHTPASAAHGCPRCPPNLCKGREITALAGRHWAGGARVLYVGDGGGDVCACLQLSEGDVVAARAGSGFALLPALTSPPLAAQMRASVAPWRDGRELLEVVMRFLEG